MIRWHKADILNRMYINVEAGKKASMPRYYKDRIYTDLEREEVAYHQLKELTKRKIEEYEQGGEGYEEIRQQRIAGAFRKLYASALKTEKL